MPSIGPMEIVVVLTLALLVFGPKRLPDMGRAAGQGLREFKGAVTRGDHDEVDERSPAPVAAGRNEPEANS